MSHLGDRVSSLVDGQLPMEAVERAHSHLANCRDCRDAVEAERLMKARLSCLPAPEPAADLVGRLLTMGGPSGPLPPRPGHVPGSPRPVPVTAWAAPPASAETVASSASGGPLRTTVRPPTRRPSRPAGRPAPARSRRRGFTRPTGRPALPAVQRIAVRRDGFTRQRIRLAGVLLGALGVVGAGVGGLALISPPDAATTPARVPFDSFVVQRPVVTPTLEMRPRAPKGALLVSASPSPTASSTTPVARGAR